MKSALRTRPLPTRTRTILGVPPPLHLPALYVPMAAEEEMRERAIACGLKPDDDTIVVDIEIAPDGQAYIERLP